MSYSKIPLFDIDWTLLRGGASNQIHHDAFDFALHTIYNQPTAFQREVTVQGKIDTQILIEVLKVHGIQEEEAKLKMPQALETMADYFREHAGEGSYEPMPGVVKLLTDLKAKGLPLGLLTGNVEAIGWEKLERAGIKDFFSFGAFGSMAFKRVDLIQKAKERVDKILGGDIPIHSFVIIGDSPLDIACARDGNISVIAVGAGEYKSHELAHADLTLESLEEEDKIFKFLNLD